MNDTDNVLPTLRQYLDEYENPVPDYLRRSLLREQIKRIVRSIPLSPTKEES